MLDFEFGIIHVIFNFKSWILVFGFWILVVGLLILIFELWILDNGFCISNFELWSLSFEDLIQNNRPENENSSLRIRALWIYFF